MTPIKGLRFLHRRVLDPTKMPDKVAQLYEVTRIARGCVYYRPVYRYEPTGREALGTCEYVLAENWHRVCLSATEDACMDAVNVCETDA